MVLLHTISFQKAPNVGMVLVMFSWHCANLEETPTTDFSSKGWSGQCSPDVSIPMKSKKVTASLFITLPGADENFNLLK